VAQNRLFVSQETLDVWLSNERVSVDGEIMTLKPEGQQFRLLTAVHFLNEVANGGDEQHLVGKVKDVAQVEGFGGELCSGSVILGDNAYEVVEGFVGEPLGPIAQADALASGQDLAAAALAAAGDSAQPEGEVDLLARFFLSSR